MNCKTFQNMVADWVSGRLPSDTGAGLAAHRAVCPRCAALARAEDGLRQRWLEMPSVPDPPDLWLRVSDRIAAPVPRRRLFVARNWAFGGAFAAAVALVVVLLGPGRTGHHTDPMHVSPADEQSVVRMVADLKAFPDPEADAYLTQSQDKREAERAVLIGGQR